MPLTKWSSSVAETKPSAVSTSTISSAQTPGFPVFRSRILANEIPLPSVLKSFEENGAPYKTLEIL